MRFFFRETFYLFINFLTYIVPKRRNSLLFYPTHNSRGFLGDMKSLFVYFANQKKEYDICWKTSSRETFDVMSQSGYRVIITNARFIWALFRSEHIVMDWSDERFYGRFSIIQLWHGSGFKNIGVLNERNGGWKFKKIKIQYSRYKFILASSVEDAERKRKGFNNPNIFITGSPRNDIFFLSSGESKEVKELYGLGSFNRTILYAPTFRDAGTHIPFSNDFWARLNQMLTGVNDVFVIKKHAWDKNLKVPTTFSNIKDLSSVVGDVQDLLSVTDVLISDYSSIITDFVMTNRPVIFYMYDFEEYIKNCRSLYYDLKEILPGPFVYNSTELLSSIQNLNWFTDDTYLQKYNAFQKRFHTYKDGGATLRVANCIQALNNNS